MRKPSSQGRACPCCHDRKAVLIVSVVVRRLAWWFARSGASTGTSGARPVLVSWERCHCTPAGLGASDR